MQSKTVLMPMPASERIAVLDVIRGFALLGIFLVNVEFFNRPVAELDLGFAPGATGLDWWVGWFVHVFVRGKFWTMFSLLFGMGFVLMQVRAERAGRGFAAPYLRRTVALAVFGLLHYVFVWAGDILFSYAMGAAFLMLVFHARPAVLVMLGVAGGVLATVWGEPDLLGLATAPLLFAAVAQALRRWPLSGLKYAGLALFLVPFALITLGGVALSVQSPQARELAAQQAATTPAEQRKLAEDKREAAARKQERAQQIVDERRVMSAGRYLEAVQLRVTTFPRQFQNDVAFAVIVVGLFLLGGWFVRSGVMENPAAHLTLFRQMAWIGLPLGLGLSLASAAIAMTHVPGVNDGPFQLASGLALLGNLPLCLGYVGAVVLAFHSRTGRPVVGLLAPAGRMALTNYIAQSAIGTLVFYGYGLGHWGMPRAQQLLFVLVVFALQVAFSHWWLGRFRHGPLEWLWRAVTYLRRPAMRREPLAAT